MDSHITYNANTTLNSDPSAAAVFSCNSSLWWSGTGAVSLTLLRPTGKNLVHQILEHHAPHF